MISWADFKTAYPDGKVLCGTRYNIHVDPTDGLLYAGEPGVQLTWMDAKVGDGSTELAEVWVVTPRIGKVVEVNALWYNTLHLLTSHGLRSLAPDDPAHVGHYGGDQRQRGAAYHQGAVWGWLIGPFVSAHLRVYGDRERARSFLQPLIHHLADHGVGSISEIFDGDPPFTPRGCIAQAWSVAEVLRAWQATMG